MMELEGTACPVSSLSPTRALILIRRTPECQGSCLGKYCTGGSSNGIGMTSLTGALDSNPLVCSLAGSGHAAMSSLQAASSSGAAAPAERGKKRGTVPGRVSLQLKDALMLRGARDLHKG